MTETCTKANNKATSLLPLTTGQECKNSTFAYGNCEELAPK